MSISSPDKKYKKANNKIMLLQSFSWTLLFMAILHLEDI